MAAPSLPEAHAPATAAAAGPPAAPGKRFPLNRSGFGFVLLHAAAVVLPFLVPVTAVGVGLCLGLYALRVFALTAGFHRYFAHRGYKTGRAFQFVLGFLGTTALQRGPIWWAGHHRTHHKHSDQEGDVHSPVTGGVWWSHVGWVLSDNNGDTPWHLMKDWSRFPELKWLERNDITIGLGLAPFCWLVGYLTGGFAGAWSALAWGFFVSTVLVYHVTFMVNSVCHLVGTKRYVTGDESRNNWLVGLLTFGEGWHNNHHHYPSAARQGFKWWEVDISYMTLKALSWAGVVWDLRQPTPRALAAKPVA